ncbi:MAG: glycosyltransferase family 39 protein [Bacteroidota bacterium]
MWRQTDCASYALNYYQNKNSFFQPQIMSRIPENGYSVSEFPIIYYFAGKLYSWFGFHDYYIRMIDFFIFIIGLIYLTLISSLYLKNKFLQLVPAIFTLGSPYIFFYSANFLPDVPALCFGFAGLFHFLLFIKQDSKMHLIISAFFFTLAALLKITSGIMWVACIIYFLQIQIKKSEKRYLKKSIAPIFIFIISWGLIYSWISFAKNYNEIHHYYGNLLGFFGIWDADQKEIIGIISWFFHFWLLHIFSISTLILFIISFFCFFVKRKMIPHELQAISLLSFIGVHLYSLGWFQAFLVHDYYMINIFCFPVLFILCFCILVEQINFNKQKSKILILTFLIIDLGWGIKHSARIQELRYTDSQFQPMPKAMYEIAPYLRSIGIKNQEVVLSAPDPSPNMSLYLMNCVGLTDGYYSDENQKNVFDNSGAKYVIVHDTSNIISSGFKNYYKSKIPIANYKGILIYKLN